MNKIDTWISEARTRAQRRKSPWNLVLAFVVIAMIGFVWFNSCKVILYLPHDSTISFREIARGHDVQMIFVTISLFFASIAWGMIIGNCMMWMVPAARRTFEREAQGRKGCLFAEAMPRLLKFAILLSVIAIPIAIFCIIQHKALTKPRRRRGKPARLKAAVPGKGEQRF